jgi:hypothetical protein
MGMLASVYRTVETQLADGTAVMQDCTNGGWSSRFNQVCIVNVPGPFAPDSRNPAVMLVRHPSPNIKSVHCVAVEHHMADKWTMMGGNFIHTSDSRFGETVRGLLGDPDANVGAIAIHDRTEG